MTRDDATDPDAAKQLVLQRAVAIVGPLIRLMLRYGVDHPSLSSAMKKAFVQHALELLHERGQNATHTALSLLTGLQRPDVKQLLAQAPSALPPRATAPSLPMQALARWTSDPRYTDGEGDPLTLPLRSSDPDIATFEELAAAVSKSVHATSLIDELVRLGLARFDGRTVRLLQTSFVPEQRFAEVLDVVAGSTRDHLAAAVTNLLSGESRFLEYSLMADELRPDSADKLHALVRKLGKTAYTRALNAANELIEQDRALGFSPEAPDTRIRFGLYFFAEPTSAPASAPAAGDSAAPESPA